MCGDQKRGKKACRGIPPQWCHNGDAISNREKTRERKRLRKQRKRENQKERERERKRERARVDCRKRGYVGTKREVKKACRGVLSQWCSGDATSNTHR